MTRFLKFAYLLAFSSIITLTTSQRDCRLTTADVEGPFYERSKYLYAVHFSQDHLVFFKQTLIMTSKTAKS